MPRFFYEAKDVSGKNIQGVVEAKNLDAAAKLLQEEKRIILELQEKGSGVFLQNMLGALSHVRGKDIVFFSHQLATLLGATVPLVRSLKTVAKQTENRYLQTVILDMAEDVDGGMKFSQSLRRYPKVFDNFFSQMVRAGETTGRLDEVLEYLAKEKEKEYTLLAEIKGAMIYPIFILVMLGVVAFLMLSFILPRITSVLEQLEVELPLSTRILIGISSVFGNYWWLILMTVVLISTFLYVVKNTQSFAPFWDAVKLKIPILGSILEKIYFVRMTRSLSNLLGAGVPIVSSLLVVSDIVGNALYRELLLEAAKKVETGQSIATAFSRSKRIPPIILNMIAVGEETGQMEKVFSRLADFYGGELQRLVKSLFQLIEPVIIVILGIATAFLVVSILLPLYNLTASVA